MSRRTADLTPEELERRRRYNREYMARTRGSCSNGVMRQGQRGASPSESAVAERDRRMAVVPTLNQQILGDPLPGRSALDRQRAEAYPRLVITGSDP